MPNDSKNIREAILDATDRLLAREGYKRMKVEDLAKEAGIGKGSVYLHFQSKEDIALAHLNRIVLNIREQIRSILDSPDPAPIRLERMLIDRVMIRFDKVQTYSQSLNELLSNVRTSLANLRKDQVEVETEMISKLIAEGQITGDFTEGDADALAKTLVDATDSLLPYSLRAFEKKDRQEVNQRTVAVTNLLIKGLRYRRQ